MTNFEMPASVGGEGRAMGEASTSETLPALANQQHPADMAGGDLGQQPDVTQTGRVEVANPSRASGKRRSAVPILSPVVVVPAAATASGATRRRKTNVQLVSGVETSSDDTNPAQAGGEGAVTYRATPRTFLPPLAETIAAIAEIAVRRRFAIGQQVRANNAVGALVRRIMGWSRDLPKPEADRIKKAAAKLIADIERGKADASDPFLRVVAPFVIANTEGLAGFDKLRDEAEKAMRKMVRALPAYEWVKAVPGFGDLAFAVVVGEAGDIGSYSNPAKLWKRLGLAVINGERQQKRSDPALAALHGYNPRRRAEMFTFFSDAMLRAQWRGEKDDAAAHAIGHYGDLYATKKAEYLARGWTPLHSDRAARRYMTKRVIRDLWREWRREAPLMSSPVNDAPPALLPEPSLPTAA